MQAIPDRVLRLLFLERQSNAAIQIAVLCGILSFCCPAGGAEIHDAAKRGDVERLRSAIRANAASVKAKDEDGRTPLHIAAMHGRLAAAQILLARGADPTASESTVEATPLHFAAVAYDTDVFKSQLQAA